MKLTFIEHDCFKITNGKVIYIDPFKIPQDSEKADMILLTHTHYDHTSKDDIDKIRKPETVFVTTADSPETNNAHVLNPGDVETIEGIEIEAVPAYNLDKEFHPKDKNWVGFILTINGKRIYHTGDSDAIPEMEDVKADVCLMPVSGIYVMTAEEAAEITKKIDPEIAIPMHYGSIVGSDEDAKTFKDKVGKSVKILKKGDSIDI